MARFIVHVVDSAGVPLEVEVEASGWEVDSHHLFAKDLTGTVLAIFAPGRWISVQQKAPVDGARRIVPLKVDYESKPLHYFVTPDLKILDVFDQNAMGVSLSVPFRRVAENRIVLSALPARPESLLALCVRVAV